MHGLVVVVAPHINLLHGCTVHKLQPKSILLVGEALDDIIMDALGREAADGSETGGAEKSLFGQLQSTVQSLQRFARQLSQ